MTANEIKLIEMIRNHKNPEEALFLAVKIILDCLTQPESFGEQESASLPKDS